MKNRYILLILMVIFTGCSEITEWASEHGISSKDKKNVKFGEQQNESINVDSLRIEYTDSDLSIQQQVTIDSLYQVVSEQSELIDSLMFEIEQMSKNIIVRDVTKPLEVEFAGQKIDLRIERNMARFEKAYKREIRSAHRFIPLTGKYFTLLDSILTANSVPTDTKYMAIAESKLSYRAHNRSGADGIWQIMPSTGKYYKLRIDDFIDERRDIYKSTDVACKLLTDYYNIFKKRGVDDWLLAYCSYNAGIGNVLKVFKNQGGTKFADLIFKTEETNEFVWKAIAIKYICENEQAIFSKEMEKNKSLTETTIVKQVKLNGYYKIDKWAKANGTTIGEVYRLNPWIKIYRQSRQKYSAINDVVLPDGYHNILIPKTAKVNEAQVAKIEKEFLNKNSGYFTHHVVQSGDNLYDIAKKYRTSVKKIKILNNLRNNMIKPGQKLKLYGVTGNRTYVVKRGESVSIISKKLGVKTKSLIALNHLKKKSNGVVLIKVGQKLIY